MIALIINIKIKDKYMFTCLSNFFFYLMRLQYNYICAPFFPPFKVPHITVHSLILTPGLCSPLIVIIFIYITKYLNMTDNAQSEYYCFLYVVRDDHLVSDKQSLFSSLRIQSPHCQHSLGACSSYGEAEASCTLSQQLYFCVFIVYTQIIKCGLFSFSFTDNTTFGSVSLFASLKWKFELIMD